MGWPKSFLLAGVVFILSASSLGQGVYEAWVARYNGQGNGYDEARAVAVDDSGNVYVTGYSVGTGTDYDYATIKYNPNGETVWVRHYNGPGNSTDMATALALDDSGNLYVTGSSDGGGTGYDYATIKYAPNGDSLWVRRYNGPGYLGNFYDGPTALALDDSGNVYVTGRSYGSGTSGDFTTIRYSPNGDTVWVRRYNGPSDEDDVATALAVNNSGDLYVIGASYATATSYDYVTIKYAPNGDTLWLRRYNGPTGIDVDFATALALDDSGDVYVTGNSYASGTGDDYLTIKYTPNGDTLWVRYYSGPGNRDDAAIALAVNTLGNVFVTGGLAISGDFPQTYVYDYATIKYAPNGDTLWVRRYNGPGSQDDEARALALDDSGNLYVTGRSNGIGTDYDYTTIKYAPNGDTLWVKRYNGSGNGSDEALDLTVDSSGNVYVTGASPGSGTGDDYATIKYSPCSAVPGDINASSDITLADIVHLLNYLFDRDNPPCIGIDPGNCWDFGLSCRGDVNASGTLTLGDVVHLLNYLFDRDNPPCIGIDPGNCWTPVASGACCLPLP